jgi:hypothetical protein
VFDLHLAETIEAVLVSVLENAKRVPESERRLGA